MKLLIRDRGKQSQRKQDRDVSVELMRLPLPSGGLYLRKES